ncbi:coniferyl alcohol acyltransferase-like [Coffea arabica]|uniref:Coniferyl alcohol acyltransferase-like n=1 Tax=Coffea arabica TaxID=13443 RepID=A0ABM4URJ4_COFAR
MGSCGFLVNVKRSEVVAAASVQKHWLPMSNLDLLLPALDVGVFFCYKKNNDTTSIPEKNLTNTLTENMVATVKKALAQALVSFYPFAGEVVQNRLGEPELLCNNRGVDFLDAFADIELKDLDLYHPDTSIHGKFVPFKNQGVLSIQATELKCGGLVIGCSFDHRVADAHSANMFFTAWAEIAQAKGTATYTAPSLRRSLLNPRRPTTYDAEIDDLYVLLSSLPPPKELKASDDRLLSRIYYIEGKEVGQLQSMASSNGCRRTKLESFSAFLWKTIAEGSCAQIKKVNLGIVVDGRKRLKGRDNEEKNFSMQTYFGNVLSIPYAEASVCDLKEMNLDGVADMIHACIEGANKEDHFLGLIDWVEEHRPQPAAAAVYFKNSEDEEAIVISLGQRFPVAQMNFGWGMPDFGSYHFHWGGQTGYVMPMPSLSREGDWIVYMNLLKKHLDIVESKSAHVFRPLNPAYLKMNKGSWM